MQACISIKAGICGFQTNLRATGNDDQAVTFAIESDCPRIQDFARRLKAHEPIDAVGEISGQSVVLATARDCLKGCCAGCVVPSGIFKGLQVAAGLALPKEITIEITSV